MYEVALEILNELEKKGFTSYIVGGYPRDKYLNKYSSDIDICTSALPGEIMNLYHIVEDNSKYGSLTITKSSFLFEITTFRKELDNISNRHPIVEYIQYISEDLKRRDFTINMLCIDKYGKYIDHYNAIDDINQKLVKTLNNSEFVISKDSLRILRAIRFATILDFKIDYELVNSIIKYGYLLENLSFYRKKQELNKIFCSSNVSYGVKMISNYGLDKYLNIYNIGNINYNVELIGIWAQLDCDSRYFYQSSEYSKIKIIRNLITKQIDNNTIYKYGIEINKVVCSIKQEIKDIEYIYNNLPIHSKSDIKITNSDIIATVKDKTMINIVLKDVEQKILDISLANNKEDIINYIFENYVK